MSPRTIEADRDRHMIIRVSIFMVAAICGLALAASGTEEAKYGALLLVVLNTPQVVLAYIWRERERQRRRVHE